MAMHLFLNTINLPFCVQGHIDLTSAFHLLANIGDNLRQQMVVLEGLHMFWG